MRLSLLAVLASGCFGKPDAPHAFSDSGVGPGMDGRPDAIDAAHVTNCSTVVFTGPETELLGTAPYVFADPSLTGDLKQIYFAHDEGTGPYDYHIWTATRASVTDPFTGQMRLMFGSGGGGSTETDPSPSSDGKVIAFLRTEGGMTYGFLATSLSAATLLPPVSSWLVVPMPGLESRQMTSLDLSPDAKTLYWNDAGPNLHIAHWNGSAFVDPTNSVYGTGFPFPAVSADGLELYFNGGGGISRVVRATPTEAFQISGATPVNGFTDPDLTPDGEVLAFTADDHASYQTRACPP